MNNTWNQNEFLAFSLLYAAHVDIEFSEEEKTKIKSLINNETYDHLYKQFIEMSDYKALETILSYKGLYFPTPARKSELLAHMKHLFEVDGDFSIMEKELLLFLGKLM
jgi:hypothetical protein